MTYKYEDFDDKKYILKVTDYHYTDRYVHGRLNLILFSGILVWENQKLITPSIKISNASKYDDWKLLTEDELLNNFIPELL